jgi:hypothetical protein
MQAGAYNAEEIGRGHKRADDADSFLCFYDTTVGTHSVAAELDVPE